MKTIFILGAGASHQAGAPLMAGFLDRAYDLLRLKTKGVVEAKREFDDVFEAISELQGIHSKSFLDLDNIETVFGAIEMGLLLKRLGKRKKASIIKLRSSLITLIYKTLEYSIMFPVHNGRIDSPPPYDRFMTTLATVQENQPSEDPHRFSFLTFNYDLCLDFALYRFGREFDYCLNSDQRPEITPLLKLHGSINWGLSEHKTILPFHVEEARFDLPDEGYVFYSLGSNLSRQTRDGLLSKGPPVIVPPTWNKNDGYYGQLSNVWSRAAYELSSAQNIFVIGYSLPETDSFFRYLYALGTESSVRLRNFVVINTDKSVESRFRQLIGRGIASRFKYFGDTFEQSLAQIQYILLRR
jgi:hypothetical protein